MALKITKLEPTKPRIKALIYGPPGSGKTTLVATANQHEDMANLLIADIDDGLLSIQSEKGIIKASIDCTQDLEELQQMAARGAEEFEGIQTIAIDSISELNDNLMREIAIREAKKSSDRKPDKNEIQDYGEATARLSRVLRFCRSLPFHIIATAHDKTDKRIVDTRKKSKHDAQVLAIYPKLPEKLGTAVRGIFDFVWYLDSDGEGGRRMLTQPNGVIAAKTRGNKFAPKLGNVVTNPNLAEIYSLLLETEV